jgi:tRNA A37 threonylcarbamoyladenosine dehydratase
MMILADGLFDGTVGHALLVGIGAVGALIVAMLSRGGWRKIQDLKRKIPK